MAGGVPTPDNSDVWLPRVCSCGFLHRLVVRTQAMIAGHRSERPCHHAIDEILRKLSARTMYGRPIPEEVASKVCSGLCMLALFAFSKDAIVQAQEAA